MADTAAHLCDRVLPPARYRQWVWTMPHAVRYWLACDGGRIAKVHALFVRSGRCSPGSAASPATEAEEQPGADPPGARPGPGGGRPRAPRDQRGAAGEDSDPATCARPVNSTRVPMRAVPAAHVTSTVVAGSTWRYFVLTHPWSGRVRPRTSAISHGPSVTAIRPRWRPADRRRTAPYTISGSTALPR
jgi:hypothetical protein